MDHFQNIKKWTRQQLNQPKIAFGGFGLFYHVKSVHKLSFHNLSIIQQINRKWAKHNVSVITTVSVLTNRDNIKFKDTRLTTLVLSVTVKQDIAVDLFSLIFLSFATNFGELRIFFSALTLSVGWQEGYSACKKIEWWGAGMVICLQRVADLHMTQLMPLPLTVTCFSKIQLGFTFLVPAHPGSPGKRAAKRVCCVFGELRKCV